MNKVDSKIQLLSNEATMIDNYRIAQSADRRCTHADHRGQCNLVSLPDQDRCYVHSNIAAKRKMGYKLTQALQALSSDTPIKSLHAEIRLLRVLVQNEVDSCTTQQEIGLRSAVISDLLTKVTKTVEACARVDKSVGESIDRAELMAIMDSVTRSLERHISKLEGGPDALGKIADDLDRILLNPNHDVE